MDTKQLDDALAKLFVDDGARIVFWHDPVQEFLDFVDHLFLTFGNITVHIIRLDQVSLLATKIRLERDEPDSRFLLYAPTAEPDSADDWLLDIRLYSRSFRADRASILLDELGLENHHVRDHLSQRHRFFDSKERLQKLQTLVTSTDTALDLDRKMLAVVVKADQPELFTMLRTLFHTWTDVEDTDAIDLGEPPACWEQIEKFDVKIPLRVGTSQIAGHGLFAEQAIRRGTKIIRYIGEKITQAESDRRLAAGNVYIFELNAPYAIDGDSPRNTARFINHSCDPNCHRHLDNRMASTARSRFIRRLNRSPTPFIQPYLWRNKA